MIHKLLILSVFFASCFLWGCKSSPKSTADAPPEPATIGMPSGVTYIGEDNRITCEGVDKIGKHHNEADLVQIYGKQNVSRDTLYAEGDPIGVVTYIYRNTPKEMWIQWLESAPFTTIRSVNITQPNAPYYTEQGIKIGMPLSLLVQLNGGVPVKFSGFGWDYGGGCCNFGNGELSKTMPCLSFQLSMRENTGLSDADMLAISGDKEISSDNPALAKAGVYISQITVGMNLGIETAVNY